MLIWFMNKVYLFFIIVCSVQLYFLSFSYVLWLHFSLPLIKITARIDRLQTQRNWQRPRIEIHQLLHIFWPQFDHLVFWEVSSVVLITASKMAYMGYMGQFFWGGVWTLELVRTQLLEKKTEKQNSAVDLWKV